MNGSSVHAILKSQTRFADFAGGVALSDFSDLLWGQLGLRQLIAFGSSALGVTIMIILASCAWSDVARIRAGRIIANNMQDAHSFGDGSNEQHVSDTVGILFSDAIRFGVEDAVSKFAGCADPSPAVVGVFGLDNVLPKTISPECFATGVAAGTRAEFTESSLGVSGMSEEGLAAVQTSGGHDKLELHANLPCSCAMLQAVPAALGLFYV